MSSCSFFNSSVTCFCSSILPVPLAIATTTPLTAAIIAGIPNNKVFKATEAPEAATPKLIKAFFKLPSIKIKGTIIPEATPKTVVTCKIPEIISFSESSVDCSPKESLPIKSEKVLINGKKVSPKASFKFSILLFIICNCAKKPSSLFEAISVAAALFLTAFSCSINAST